MNEKRITRISASEIHKLGPGNTDWARIGALTDEEIESAMRNDTDWAELVDFEWSDAELVVPTKKMPISIRLDEDVIQFFKDQGEGYQTRINAVLRHYVAATKKSAAAE